MERVTKPKVKTIVTGKELMAKQMQAKAGDLLPKHQANLESVLFVQEGECILNINNEEHLLKKGEAFAVPPEIKHQIKAKTDFTGIHFMPESIEFKFFK